MRVAFLKPDPPIEDRVDEIIEGKRTSVDRWETLVELKNRLEGKPELQDRLNLFRVEKDDIGNKVSSVKYTWGAFKTAIENGLEVR